MDEREAPSGKELRPYRIPRKDIPSAVLRNGCGDFYLTSGPQSGLPSGPFLAIVYEGRAEESYHAFGRRTGGARVLVSIKRPRPN